MYKLFTNLLTVTFLIPSPMSERLCWPISLQTLDRCSCLNPGNIRQLLGTTGATSLFWVEKDVTLGNFIPCKQNKTPAISLKFLIFLPDWFWSLHASLIHQMLNGLENASNTYPYVRGERSTTSQFHQILEP